MATGRTLARWSRVYINGYPACTRITNYGPLVSDYAQEDLTSICDAVQGSLPAQGMFTPTAVNGIIDAGNHFDSYYAAYVNTSRVVQVNVGIRGDPAAGDPVFAGQWYLNAGRGDFSNGSIPFNIEFGDWDVGNLIAYRQPPWGRLLHAGSAETAANSATGGVDNGAATTYGGWFVYSIYNANGAGVTFTLSVDDSADDSSYSALSGATSGELTYAGATAGIVALGTTATVRRYLRWQLALNTATSVSFTSAFIRGRNPDY